MRIVRFTPGPDAGLGQDPLFGVLEDDATISIISGDPIYSGIQKTAAKIELNKVRLLAPIIPRSRLSASARTTQITPLKWAELFRKSQSFS